MIITHSVYSERELDHIYDATRIPLFIIKVHYTVGLFAFNYSDVVNPSLDLSVTYGDAPAGLLLHSTSGDKTH